MREILEQIQDDCAQRFGKGEHSTAAPYSRTLYVRVVLIFLIAGLLYLLRFKRVDNLGAYSIPSETGLLIPSGFVNNAHPSLWDVVGNGLDFRMRAAGYLS